MLVQPENRMNCIGKGSRRLRGFAPVLGILVGLGLSLPGCFGMSGGLAGAETLEWKEEVALHDGGALIVTLRVQLVPGGPFQTMAGARRLTFSHPTTGQPIVWENAGTIGSRLYPILLDVDADRLFLVTLAASGPDYDTFGCPTPPYIVLRYEAATWARVPLSELPTRFARANVIASLEKEVLREAHGYLTAAEIAVRLDAVRRRADTEHLGRIDRRLRNPLGLGCSRDAIERVYGVEKYDEWRRTGNWLDKSEAGALDLLRRKGEGVKP